MPDDGFEPDNKRPVALRGVMNELHAERAFHADCRAEVERLRELLALLHSKLEQSSVRLFPGVDRYAANYGAILWAMLIAPEYKRGGLTAAQITELATQYELPAVASAAPVQAPA